MEKVYVHGEHKQQEFDLHALLFVTINDCPALSNLSGQTNKGYHACTVYLTPIVYTWQAAGRMCTWAIIDFFRPTINVERKASISKARQFTGRSPPCVLVITYLLWS